MSQFSVRYYQNKRGDKLVEKFILGQDEAVSAKFLRIVDILEDRGPNLGMPYSRNLGNGLYELRIRGKKEIRIFYVSIYKPQTIVLLHAFIKRTPEEFQKKELAIACMRQEELT